MSIHALMAAARWTRLLRLPRRWRPLVAVGVLLVCGALYAASPVDPLLGKPAPAFIRPDIHHQRMDLNAFKGHVVLLTFWATWCGPCRVEMPHFIAWQRQYGPEGLQILGISMDDDAAPVTELDRKLKINYPIIMGDEEIGSLYGGILGLPITYLIDRNGIVRAKFKGNFSLHSMELEVLSLLRHE